MATAPGHLLGQIIGNVIEEALQPVLQELADRHDLYLDSKGPRPGVRSGRQQRVMRTIDHIVVTPLHGHGSSYPSAPDAVAAVRSYSCGVEAAPFLRFEIRIPCASRSASHTPTAT